MTIKKLTPNLAVQDIKKTVAFYQEHLGFALVMAVPESQDGIEQVLNDGKEYVYALMQCEGAEIMFQRVDTFKRDVILATDSAIGASTSFYMEVDDIVGLHQKIKATNAQVTDIKTTWYGMQEFYLRDLNGYILGFAQPK